MKRIVALLLCILLAFGMTACASADLKEIGSGTPGVVEKLDWSEYDELLKKATMETDLQKRSLLLHKAEELLISTYAAVPLVHGIDYFLMKTDCHGAYMTRTGNFIFSRMYRDGDDQDSQISLYAAKEMPSMDSVANSSMDVSTVIMNTSASLLRTDENGNILPDLAESYELSDDGCTYTFTLRDNLKWSDGSVLDANDFVFSWKRATDPKNGLAFSTNLSCIKGYPDDLDVSASEDGKILTVHLDVPVAYFPSLCQHSSFYPVQEEYMENYPGYRDESGKIVNHSVWASEAGYPSAGPYVIESWKHNESMILKKNPYYYDADSIKTESFALMLNGDSASIYGAYASDTISAAYGSLPSDIKNKLLTNPEFHSQSALSTSLIYFNVIDPLFAGLTKEEAITVRKALALAIDRNFICKVALQSGASEATTIVPTTMNDGTENAFGDTPGYEYPYENGYYKFEPDLDEARRLLESVGYDFDKDGKLKTNLTVEYLFNPSGDNEAIATCIQADWAQLGVNTNLSSREWAVFLGERSQHHSESYRGSWSADYDDPYTFLSLFNTDSPNNDCALGLDPK